MVCADWRSEYRPSPMAVCGLGGAEGAKRAELECGGLGRYRTQDGSADSDDEESDFDPNALEPSGIRELYTYIDDVDSGGGLLGIMHGVR